MFAYQWLANELRNVGDYADAASAYEAAVRIKSDDSAAHCQLALIRARQGQLPQAVHEYGAALIVAKLQELNDSDCLIIADHVLDESFDAHKPAQEKEAIAGLKNTKERMKLAAQSASAQYAVPVVQAALHTAPR
jgi:tetratricopeptide (TPR) repeat protein